MAGGLAGELEEFAEESRWEEARDAMPRLRVVGLLRETEGLTNDGPRCARSGLLRDRDRNNT
jgi:hypothetical protein